MTRFKISFQLRNPKDNKKTPIICLVSRDGRVKIGTNISIHPDFWSQENKRVKRSHSKYQIINTQLDEFESMVESVFLENPEYTLKEIRQLLYVKIKGEEIDINVVFEKYLKLKSNCTKRTIYNYRLVVKYIKEMFNEQGKDFNFSSFDKDFLPNFKNHLEQKNYSLNHIGSLIAKIKAFLNYCNAEYETSIKTKLTIPVSLQEETTEVYLTEEELELIYNYKFKKANHQNAINLFLILCWTGQRSQTLGQILSKYDGSDFIQVKQDKTQSLLQLPIIPIVHDIMKRKPTFLVNQKINNYIKIALSEIPNFNIDVESTITKGGKKITETKKKWEMISTHTGRRSFATNFYNQQKFPLSVIMAITGHKKESTFFKYIRATPREKAERFLDIFNKSK